MIICAGRGGGNASDRKGKVEEKGKIPTDYRKFKDASGNEVCVRFNKEDGCPEVTFNTSWYGLKKNGFTGIRWNLW